MQHQLALGVDLEFVGALEAEHDPLRIRSGCDDEVVLKLTLVAEVDEIYPGIDPAVMHFGVGRNVSAPLRWMFADEVIGLAGEGVEPAHERLARRTHETHADHGRLRWRLRIAPLGQAARVAFCIRVGLVSTSTASPEVR